jgi:hypothetical protein
MSRLDRALRTSLKAAALAAALVAPVALRAQRTAASRVFDAGNVPGCGSVKRIREVHLEQECAVNTTTSASYFQAYVRCAK